MSQNYTFECESWGIKDSRLYCPPTTASAGRSNSGHEQIIYQRNQYWRGEFTLNPMFGEIVPDYEGFITGLDGRYNTFDMCVCDPFSLKGSDLTYEEYVVKLGYVINDLCGPDINGLYGEPFSDGTCFADGTGFNIPAYTAAVVDASAASGSRSLDVGETGNHLKRGNLFSTSDNYLHRVIGVVGRTVLFNPPLRRDIAAGEVLETENPKIRVRLATDDAGVSTRNYGRYTNETGLSVVEAMKR